MKLYTHLHESGSLKKNPWFSTNYDRGSIDISPLGLIINDQLYQLYQLYSSAIIAINSPTAPDASSAYNEVKCHS